MTYFVGRGKKGGKPGVKLAVGKRAGKVALEVREEVVPASKSRRIVRLRRP